MGRFRLRRALLAPRPPLLSEYGPQFLTGLAAVALLWAALSAVHLPSLLAVLVVCAVVLEVFAGDVLRPGRRVIGPSLAVLTMAFSIFGAPAAVLVGFTRGATRLLVNRVASPNDVALTLGSSALGPLAGGLAAVGVMSLGASQLLAFALYAAVAYLVEVSAPQALLRRTGAPSLALSIDSTSPFTALQYFAVCALGFAIAPELTAGNYLILLALGAPLVIVRWALATPRATADRYMSALEIENKEFFDRIGQLDRVNGDLIDALAIALDYRDGNDSGRSRRVAGLSLSIGSTLGMDAPELETLRRGAILHDIGMLAESGERTPHHVAQGARLVARWRDYRAVADIIEQHRERLDGSGYPRGLRGDEIGLPARIVAVAEEYVSLTSPLPYGASLSSEAAFARIAMATPTKFDARVVEALHAAVTSRPADVVPLRQRM